MQKVRSSINSHLCPPLIHSQRLESHQDDDQEHTVDYELSHGSFPSSRELPFFQFDPLCRTREEEEASSRRSERGELTLCQTYKSIADDTVEYQRRTHAIEAARSSSRDLVDIEDLSIAGSNDSSSSDVESSVVNNNDNSQTSTSSSQTSPPPHISKQKRKSYKPTFKSWAKNLLCQAETLDLREGVLPYGIERDYRMSVVPKGKRCLCATTNDSSELNYLRVSSLIRGLMIQSSVCVDGKNTILYSRVAG